MKPTDDNHLHPTIHQNKRTIYVFKDYLPITGKLYGDPTGWFLATSTSVNTHILVVCDYDSNIIHTQYMTSATKKARSRHIMKLSHF